MRANTLEPTDMAAGSSTNHCQASESSPRGQEQDASAPDQRFLRRRRADQPAAIVGYSCAFPKSPDPEVFWRNLEAGRDCLSDRPDDRWETPICETPELQWSGFDRGGFLDDLWAFDPAFFGMTQAEAERMDPQHRLLLRHTWAAIEHAGHSPCNFAGRNVGVFIAIGDSGYAELAATEDLGINDLTGSIASMGPNRISQFFDLHGPSEAIESTCSSSLVAIRRAVRAIAAGECEMAIAGGVNALLSRRRHLLNASAGLLSPSGVCRPFSPAGDGFVRSEGIGVLVLRRYEDAEADNDTIHALIRGSGVRHGGQCAGIGRPDYGGLADLFRRIYTEAGIEPSTVGYVEANGIGFPSVDTAEIEEMKSAFRDLSWGVEGGAPMRCGFGSVKSNIGNAETAAGMASIIKVLLQLRHRILVPSLHSEPAGGIREADGPFQVVQDRCEWPATTRPDGTELPRRAGVTAMSIGGLNAHVLLEEHVEHRPILPGPGRAVPVPLSAASPASVRAQARRLADWIEAGHVGAADLWDLAYTLQVGRKGLRHRMVLVASDMEDLRLRLRRFAENLPAQAITGIAEADAGYPDDEEDSPEAAARRWVAGGQVDWRELDPQPRRRLPLPTYPFEQTEVRRPDGRRTGAVSP